MLFDFSQHALLLIGLQIFCPDEYVKSNALCYVPYTEQDLFNIHSGGIFEAKLNLCCCCFGLAIFEAAHVLKARTAGAFNPAQTKLLSAISISSCISLYLYPQREIDVIALLDCLVYI